MESFARFERMDSKDLPNDFAHLSTDIIFDVVKTEAPRVRDLAGFATLTGNWSDIVKSNDVFATHTTGAWYTKSCIDDEGYHENETLFSPPPGNYRMDNVSVYLDLSSSSEWSVLSECVGKVCLAEEFRFTEVPLRLASLQQVERFDCALKLLMERPITQLILVECKSLYNFYRSQLPEPFCWNVMLERFISLIMKPKLQSLTIDCNRVLDEEVEQCLFEFVKKPNFLLLKAPLSSTFLPKLLDYWLTLTTFPNYVQTVEYEFSYHEKLAIALKGLHFRLQSTDKCMREDCVYQQETYFRKHPNNEHRGIEISHRAPTSFKRTSPSQIISVRLV